MKAKRAIWLSLIFMGSLVATVVAQMGARPSEVAKRYEDLKTKFKAGDTNGPLLTITWFEICHRYPQTQEETCATRVCDVRQGGDIFRGLKFLTENYGKDGELNRTNLTALGAALSRIPDPPKELPVAVNRLHIGGIRSNQWFYGVYNRTNLTAEVKTVLEKVAVKF